MNWETIDFRQRNMRTVAGKCSVLGCRPGVYALSLNRKELLRYNAIGWDDAMQRAELHLLDLANKASSCELQWKTNWTTLTPLGILTVKFWVKFQREGFEVTLGNKVIHTADIIDILPTSNADTIRLKAVHAFEQLAKNLAAELS